MVVNKEIPEEEQQPGPLRQCNNLAESSNDRSSDAEGHDFTCKICEILWIELTDWVQCDICDEYICPKCYGKRDISADDHFFVVFASDQKYKDQISIQLSIINHAMNLSNFIH